MSSAIQDVINDLEFRKIQIENAIAVLRELEFGSTQSPPKDEESRRFECSQDNNFESSVTDIIKQSESGIQREDIVKCVHVEERDLGVDEDLIPEVGHEYRVISVLKKGKKILGYEVLDDKSDNKIRMPMFPNEIQLLRKRKKKPPRVMIPSVIKKCECGDDIVLLLNKEETHFECVCENCGVSVKEKRVKPKE